MESRQPGSQELEAMRERLSRLMETCLRLNESLDFNTVLNGVLDSALSLTGARYGVMTLFDESGNLRDFLSSGMTAEETQQLWDLPEGTRLLQYLGNLDAPCRLGDVVGHLRSKGFPEFRLPLAVGPQFPFLAAPVLRLGQRVGHIFVGEKESGNEFTQEDEETLVQFTSLAALVIGNAGIYLDEQRAKIDLETLINISPVGVLVFDARTGAPVSINPEAGRIVDGLRNPDQSLEEFMQTATYRRADGRVISPEEIPVAQALTFGETVRAEEIVVQTPDGRSVTTLVNATPIRSAEGEVESVIITVQDMTSRQEMERLRAEFLGTVSHELRMPLTSIKGSITNLLASEDLDPAEMRQFHRIIDQQTDSLRDLISDLLDVARIETGTLPVSPEPVEVAVLVDRARNTFLSGGGRHKLDIDLAPGLPLVMADRRRLVQVIGNLLSNAARYSPESTEIRLGAARRNVHVEVSVTDKGRGIPAERLPHLFQKFSRAQAEDHRDDTGLGLAICKGIVEAHGGRIWAESDGEGLGARFIFTVPAVEEDAHPAARDAPRLPQGRAKDKTRILVVDDDPQTLTTVRQTLSAAGFEPVVTADPNQVLVLTQQHRPHLVLLDLVLPGFDGIELMRDLLRMADVPVIFLSGYGSGEVISRAFDTGAADYIVKPFSSTELVARVRAVLRRREHAAVRTEPAQPYVLGDLTIDYGERRVTVAGRLVPLTPSEYGLLFELSVNAGRVVTYGQLLRRVWGPGDKDLGRMRTLIKKLRRKLNDRADNPTYLFTERGVGYRMPKGQTTTRTG